VSHGCRIQGPPSPRGICSPFRRLRAGRGPRWVSCPRSAPRRLLIFFFGVVSPPGAIKWRSDFSPSPQGVPLVGWARADCLQGHWRAPSPARGDRPPLLLRLQRFFPLEVCFRSTLFPPGRRLSLEAVLRFLGPGPRLFFLPGLAFFPPYHARLVAEVLLHAPMQGCLADPEIGPAGDLGAGLSGTPNRGSNSTTITLGTPPGSHKKSLPVRLAALSAPQKFPKRRRRRFRRISTLSSFCRPLIVFSRFWTEF